MRGLCVHGSHQCAGDTMHNAFNLIWARETVDACVRSPLGTQGGFGDGGGGGRKRRFRAGALGECILDEQQSGVVLLCAPAGDFNTERLRNDCCRTESRVAILPFLSGNAHTLLREIRIFSDDCQTSHERYVHWFTTREEYYMSETICISQETDF